MNWEKLITQPTFQKLFLTTREARSNRYNRWHFPGCRVRQISLLLTGYWSRTRLPLFTPVAFIHISISFLFIPARKAYCGGLQPQTERWQINLDNVKISYNCIMNHWVKINIKLVWDNIHYTLDERSLSNNCIYLCM